MGGRGVSSEKPKRSFGAKKLDLNQLQPSLTFRKPDVFEFIILILRRSTSVRGNAIFRSVDDGSVLFSHIRITRVEK